MKFKQLSGLSVKEMRKICQPSSSRGHWNMNLLRRVSIYLSILFLYLRITPTVVTFARFFIGLIGISFIAWGTYPLMLTGLIIFQFSYLLDLNDGEMFRYNAWKTGKRESFLKGSFLDKVFDQIYRPLLVIAAGIGSAIYTGQSFYLYLGIAGSLLISMDILIKLRVLDVLVYKQQLNYLKSAKEDIGLSSGKLDLVYELFRINNGLTLYFWFGIFGYLHIFLIIYTPLLFLLVIKTFFSQYKAILAMDKEILKKRKR